MSRILLVDDERVCREGLEALLACDDSYEVVQAADGPEALRLAAACGAANAATPLEGIL